MMAVKLLKPFSKKSTNQQKDELLSLEKKTKQEIIHNKVDTRNAEIGLKICLEINSCSPDEYVQKGIDIFKSDLDELERDKELLLKKLKGIQLEILNH